MWHSIFWHRGRGPLADIRAKAFSPTIQCNVLHCIAQYIAPIAPRTLFTCLPGGRYLLVYIYIAACRFIFNNMTKYSDYTWTNITKESSPRFWWWMARNYLSLSFYSDLFFTNAHTVVLFCAVLFLQRHNHSLQLWCCCGVVHTHNPKFKLHTFMFIKRIRRL